jgi:hypothetical protein
VSCLPSLQPSVALSLPQRPSHVSGAGHSVQMGHGVLFALTHPSSGEPPILTSAALANLGSRGANKFVTMFAPPPQPELQTQLQARSHAPLSFCTQHMIQSHEAVSSLHHHIQIFRRNSLQRMLEITSAQSGWLRNGQSGFISRRGQVFQRCQHVCFLHSEVRGIDSQLQSF